MKEPYTFIPSAGYLKELSRLSPRLKLEWLEEANEFINKFVSRKKKKKWEKFIHSTTKAD